MVSGVSRTIYFEVSEKYHLFTLCCREKQVVKFSVFYKFLLSFGMDGKACKQLFLKLILTISRMTRDVQWINHEFI